MYTLIEYKYMLSTIYSTTKFSKKFAAYQVLQWKLQETILSAVKGWLQKANESDERIRHPIVQFIRIMFTYVCDLYIVL
jgi:hypothetical protein